MVQRFCFLSFFPYNINLLLLITNNHNNFHGVTNRKKFCAHELYETTQSKSVHVFWTNLMLHAPYLYYNTILHLFIARILFTLIEGKTGEKSTKIISSLRGASDF